MSSSAAYYNWGRWVADCAAPQCTDAREVSPGMTQAACKYGHLVDLEWPPQELAAQIVAVLAERPERHRSWFPADHPLALAMGQPHGQTVEELRAETAWLNEQVSPPPPTDQPPLAEVLATYGLGLADDGTTLRRL